MSSNRIFFTPNIPDTGEYFDLDVDESAHAVRVMRLQPGDPLGLLDGCGTRAQAVVDEIRGGRRNQVVACQVQQREVVPTPVLHVHLHVAPPRAKQMSQVIREATELGVWSITPVICDYSVSRPAADVQPHWQAEAVAACKQSGNPFLPVIKPPIAFSDALAATAHLPGVFGEIPSPESRSIAPAMAPPLTGDITLWVGPEGGFSEAEKQQLLEHKHLPVSAGDWILRVETAVAALLGWLYARNEG